MHCSKSSHEASLYFKALSQEDNFNILFGISFTNYTLQLHRYLITQSGIKATSYVKGLLTGTKWGNIDPDSGAWTDLEFYLASDESTFTTGQAHIIDGGWSG